MAASRVALSVVQAVLPNNAAISSLKELEDQATNLLAMGD